MFLIDVCLFLGVLSRLDMLRMDLFCCGMLGGVVVYDVVCSIYLNLSMMVIGMNSGVFLVM